MPTMVTNSAVPPQGKGRSDERSPQALPLIPFIRASAEHRETMIDSSLQLSAGGSRDMGSFDVPAYGYVRSILLLVTIAGGAGTPNFDEGYPFNVIRDISFSEPNGAQIAQFNTGYDLYLANKWGGYRAPFGADPKTSPVYSSGAATGDAKFILRIPIELNLRDGLGALPNQNSGATFKLRFGLASGAANGGLWGSTAPTTQPTVRVQAILEAWDQPDGGQGGQMNATNPPAAGTTQFWSTQVFNVNPGQNTIRLTRTGQYIRNLILVGRRGGTSRLNGDADFPDPLSLFLDTRPVDQIPKDVWRHTMYERSGFGGRAPGGALTAPVANEAAGGLDNGVFLYDFTHEFDGSLGQENRDLWLPTLGSTRLELQGSFAQAGTLTVITNDVAVGANVFM